MVRRNATLLGLAGLIAPGMVFGLGLGELSLQSYLNEPLRAEVVLLESAGLNPEQVKIRLAAREDFERAGIERQYFLTSLKFEVILEQGSDGRLLISSPQPVREPFLDFIIEARWPNGRLLREYTLLLDPPVFTGTRSSRSDGGPADVSSGSAVDAQRDPPEEPPVSERPKARVPREYDSEASDQPAAGGKYLVQRNETLWAIASRAKPENASVQQTMLDIQRLNPEAFIGNNVNRLKAGYVLRLPTADDISNDNFDEAVAAIALQEERWEAAREGRRLDASEDAGSSGVVGDEEGGGRLQIAGADEDPAAGFGESEAELTASLENLDRAQRDNADMRARVDAMEEQVATMQRLLNLKDEQIASLQQTLGEAATDEVTGIVEPVGETVDPAGAEDPESGAGASAQAEVEADVEAGEATPAPAPKPAPVVAEDKGLMSMLMDNLLYVGLGVLALVLLLVMALRRRSNDDDFTEEVGLPRQADSDDEFADVQLGEDGLIVDQFQEEVASAEEDLGGESKGFTQDEDMYAARFESGDALAEADIYIAYGRYPQAVDVLKSAIVMDPVNTDLRLKLIEACAEMAEREEFQQQYADLQLIGDEDALAKARDHLEIVDGGEMWLEDLPNPSITMAEVDAARQRQAEGALRAEPMVEFVPDEAPEQESTGDTDGEFSLDMDADVGMAPADDDGKVDLDVNLEIEEMGAAGAATAAAGSLDEVSLDAAVEAGDSEDALSLDLDSESETGLGDFPLEDLEPLAQDEPSIEPLAGDDELLDLGLDDGGDLAGKSADLSGGSEPELELADELDGELLTEFGELTIEGEEGLGGGEPNLDQSLGELSDSLAAGGSAAPGDEEESDEGDMVFASNGDESATKLDLARAYMDMGDDDGARSILEEVLADGNGSQKQEAQSLLDSLG